jgi:DNA invertase Pin-like site-specific DNA recombinase
MWQLPALKPEEILEYLRKSRTDDPLLSVQEVLEKHEQMLAAWAEKNLPGPIPEENIYREVVSGETIDSRPQVVELLRRVESPKIKAILITEPQRLSRGDLEDIGRLVKILRYTNTLVITLQYVYDLKDARDRDDFERELKRGNEFLEYQKRIMNNGKLLSVENGNYIANRAPYGYRKIAVKDGRRTCYTLEIVPEEAKVIRMIFEMYAQGAGSHKVARRLNELGFQSPNGGVWAPENLSKVRSNEHYLGHVVWGRRKTVKNIEDGELVMSRPVSQEYLVYKGKHEAIIDQELWDRVQEMRGKVPKVKSKAKCSNPLAGLLFCQCGRFMSRRTYKKKNGDERSAARYICDHQTTCGTGSCTVDELLVEVAKVLREAIEDFQVRATDAASDRVAQHLQMIARLEQRVEVLNQLEISYWEKYALESMPKAVFDKLNEKLLKEREEVQQALYDARESMPEPVDFEAKRVMFSEALTTLLDPEAPALQKNILLKQCIERIDFARKQKDASSRRYGEPEPMELDFHLKV